MDSPRVRPDAGGFFLVDSHGHLDMPEFDPDREEVLSRARAAGVAAILCPIDVSSERSLRTTLAMTAAHGEIAAAAGLHPHQAKLADEKAWLGIGQLAEAKSIRAVGEIGLDYHSDFATPVEQQDVFRRQLSLAADLGLPVIVHSRAAGQDVLAAVDSLKFSGGGVLHCFTEDWAYARAMLDRGFMISFSGIVTFPKAEALREVAARVPLDRLLVETDAPYLAPLPHRGKRNEPAFVVETARRLAEIRSMSLALLADATTANYLSLFGFR